MPNAVLKSCPYVTRYEGNPILTCKDVPYDCTLVFNAGVIKYKGKYVMVFRNDYNHINGSRFEGTNLGICTSDDGIRWKVKPEVCFDIRNKELEAKFDVPAGEITRCYDPRLTVIESEVYMTFAVDTCHGLRGGIAKTTNFKDWEILSLSVPDNRNMVLFPERINGNFVRLERPMPIYSRGGKDRFDIWMSESPDMVYWGNSRLVAGVEDFPFANDKVGPGAPPVRTKAGWLVATHTVDIDASRGKNGWEDRWIKRYCAGLMLLDLNEPWKVLGLSKVPLIAPEASYEREEGFRTNVVFPTGMIRLEDGTIRIYYGAADTVIALAEAREDDLIQLCLQGR